MANRIPGTTLPITGEMTETLMETLMPFLNITGGLMLSQLCDITGLEPATIQNWVKRGFVSSPVAKKYSKEQISRILMINALRDIMYLDKIAVLLSFINGNLLDTSDDIITDSELYIYFCRSTFHLGSVDTANKTVLLQKIRETLADYQGTGKEKLETVLLIMVLMYRAAILKEKAEEILSGIELQE